MLVTYFHAKSWPSSFRKLAENKVPAPETKGATTQHTRWPACFGSQVMPRGPAIGYTFMGFCKTQGAPRLDTSSLRRQLLQTCSCSLLEEI